MKRKIQRHKRNDAYYKYQRIGMISKTSKRNSFFLRSEKEMNSKKEGWINENIMVLVLNGSSEYTAHV